MKTATMCIFAVTLCGANLHAQKTTTTPGHATEFVKPTEAVPGALQKIFSNLGPPTNAYIANGYYVAGPNSALGSSQSVGLPFVATQNATAEVLAAAISWNSSGANEVNLSLYSDASGNPGTVLAGPVTVRRLPTFGTCCTVAKAVITPTPLTAGTVYWIVADLPSTGTGSDSEDVWDSVAQLNIAADVADAGWFNFAANLTPAGAVLGTLQ